MDSAESERSDKNRGNDANGCCDRLLQQCPEEQLLAHACSHTEKRNFGHTPAGPCNPCENLRPKIRKMFGLYDFVPASKKVKVASHLKVRRACGY